jgi:hypothetical protein
MKRDDWPPAGTAERLGFRDAAATPEENDGIGILVTVRASDVRAGRVQWFATNRIPFGALTLFDGDGDIGKTTTLMAVIAAATRGRSFLDGAEITPINVLIVSEEDAFAILKLRLIAAGADLDRVRFITGVRVADSVEPFALPRHVPQLEREVAQNGARFVYVDSLFSHLEFDGDGRMPQQARRAVRPIVEMVVRTGVAFAAVRHWTKANGPASARALGSVELGNVARSVLSFGRHPDAEDRYVIAVTKHNLSRQAPTLAYRIDTLTMTDDDGEPCDVTRVVLEGEAEGVSADDLAMRQSGDPDERAAAEDWLADYLGDEEWHPCAEVYKAARKDGAGSPPTMRRAARRLGVERDRSGFPSRSKWRLRAVCSQFAHSESVSKLEQTDERTEQTAPPDGLTSESFGAFASMTARLLRDGRFPLEAAPCAYHCGSPDERCQRCGGPFVEHISRQQL